MATTPAKKTSTKAATSDTAAPKKTKAATAEKKQAAEKKPAAAKKVAKPKASKSGSISSFERYKMIEVAAYYLAEKNGFAGSSVEYWTQAEQAFDAS